MSKKKDVMTDPLLSKGHAHKVNHPVPVICPACKGLGIYTDNYTGLLHDDICPKCEGEGVVVGHE